MEVVGETHHFRKPPTPPVPPVPPDVSRTRRKVVGVPAPKIRPEPQPQPDTASAEPTADVVEAASEAAKDVEGNEATVSSEQTEQAEK